MKKLTNFAKPIFVILLFFAVVLLATILKVTGSVVVPLTLAVLLSLVFEPVLELLSKKYKIPWVVAILVIFLVLTIAISAISSLLITSMKAIISSYPKYEERFFEAYKEIAQIFSLPFDNELSLFSNLWSQLEVRNAVQTWIISFSSSLIAFAKNIVMIMLFALFFMIELKHLRPKLQYVFTFNKTQKASGDKVDTKNELVANEVAEPNIAESVSAEPNIAGSVSAEPNIADNDATTDNDSNSRISQIFSDVITQVTRYISVKFLTSFATGVIVFLGTLIIGLDFPIVWAFLAFVLNFIPNFGSIISVLITTCFSLIQFWNSPSWILIVFVTLFFMTAVNFIIGNILEPRIQGQNLGLSPFVIIVSLSVWGWIWGFIGLVIAVPMMVIVKIICENFEILYPFSILIGSWPIKKKN